jgi:GNAT superfamily N-acetyltransferase
MKVEKILISDIDSWLELAREVEPLFGPMVDEAGFHDALKAVISEERAFCIRDDGGKLCSAIVLSYEKNEIEWLAVTYSKRRKGYGEMLLNYAISRLSSQKPIAVQTFANTVLAGVGARNLYIKFGFKEVEQAGLNPAGIPTVILERAPV